MSTEKSALRISELDFDSIKTNLKEYLRAQDEFQDFDFDGAGMSVLLDILAYNTHYMGYYLNMVANESALDTAQIRSMVLSHAKHIGYVPSSRKGAKSQIDVTVTPSNTEDQDASTITLEKYTKLLGADIDGVNHQFVTLYSNTATKDAGSFYFSNVNIKQGEVITLQYAMTSTNEKRRFTIPSQNVDTDSLIITVQESSSNTDTWQYTLADDITELDANSKVYFLEEDADLTYTFYFGDDVIGKKPRVGNIIIATYLDTVGSESNNITRFTFVEPIAGEYQDNVRVTAALASYNGVDKETIEQVRFRAPYHYTAQNRAVIDTDYMSLLVKDYNFIDSVAVWGGEDNDPVIYGKVFISVKTSGNYYLTNYEKENIKNELIRKRNVLTVTPEIVDPDYAYILVNGTVYYNSTLTSKTSGELLTLVKSAVNNYSDENLDEFNAYFRKSKLQTYIENVEKSITGSDIDIQVQKQVKIDTTQRKSYTIQFNMPLKRGTYTDKLTTFPSIEVYDSYNVSRDAYLEEVPETLTGVDSVSVADGGSGYLTAPTVTITGDGTGATATARILSGRVSSIEITSRGTNYTSAIATISGGSGSGASATVKLQLETGTIRSVYYKSNGEKVVISDNVGTIDYSTGTVVLNALRIYSVEENDFYDDNYLTVNAPIESDIISPLRNRIMSIDENDPKSIKLTMVAQ